MQFRFSRQSSSEDGRENEQHEIQAQLDEYYRDRARQFKIDLN